MVNSKITVRKARISDARSIKNLIDFYSSRGTMLPRSLSNIYENIRDFFVAELNSEIVGCIALHIIWDDLAEIRSLAVSESHKNTGIGTSLLKEAILEAEELGIERVFTLTYALDFFEKHGFKRISKSRLPQKIWKDCLECSRFPDCEEEALILNLKKEKKR
jgi:amino-acid N-acetyltransferase